MNDMNTTEIRQRGCNLDELIDALTNARSKLRMRSTSETRLSLASLDTGNLRIIVDGATLGYVDLAFGRVEWFDNPVRLADNAVTTAQSE